MDISWPQSPVTVIDDVAEPIPLATNHFGLLKHPLTYVTTISLVILIYNLCVFGFTSLKQNFMIGIDPKNFIQAGMLVSPFPFEASKVRKSTFS